MDAKLVEAWHLDAAASKGGGAKHGGSAAKQAKDKTNVVLK